ncbi:MAG TPA: CpaD family pilus assembly protein [Xanthobacteraceae bacterium]|nr:CpaD family pilus assembly protein [Xanthobacteraceae bacterium]
MHCVRTPITDRRAAMRLALRTVFAVGFAALVCGCKTDQQITAAPDVPADYRLRHPISITEKDHTLQLFIGANRGSLMPEQRAELLAFGQTWRDQATGGVIVDLPVGSSNERSAADSLREIESILAATGVPARSIAVRNYRVSSRVLATVRITYPRIAAQAGPCGIWPKDIGPSLNRDYFENQPNWNYGCATQRNLAAMVANPADLVQPRAETPIYAPRRTAVMEKYRLGQPTATTEVNATPPAGKITDLGQ